jgi:hypothetical protein
MNLYLDDDSAQALLARLLRAAGHDVVLPADVGMTGKKDPAHFLRAIQSGRTLLTRNYEDFNLLHELILGSGGHHPGLMVVRRDNDPTRDLRPGHVVRAIRNLHASGVPIADELHILNHWR